MALCEAANPWTGPPLSIAMDFIASGMITMVTGLASAAIVAAYHWWAGVILAGAWLATHYLLRESGVWYDRNTPEVRGAQRDTDYGYRLAVDPPASKVLNPIHRAVSTNLGDRTAAWLYDRLTEACVRPPGIGHLEDPSLTTDLTVARDFDLGMVAPLAFAGGIFVLLPAGLAFGSTVKNFHSFRSVTAKRSHLPTLEFIAIMAQRRLDEL